LIQYYIKLSESYSKTRKSKPLLSKKKNKKTKKKKQQKTKTKNKQKQQNKGAN
jgi:hypothetical protein